MQNGMKLLELINLSKGFMYQEKYEYTEYALGYRDGQLDLKEKILEILKQPLQNLDLSTDECDSRYIEKIKNL
jgi:hypothetical protein